MTVFEAQEKLSKAITLLELISSSVSERMEVSDDRHAGHFGIGCSILTSEVMADLAAVSDEMPHLTRREIEP